MGDVNEIFLKIFLKFFSFFFWFFYLDEIFLKAVSYYARNYLIILPWFYIKLFSSWVFYYFVLYWALYKKKYIVVLLLLI